MTYGSNENLITKFAAFDQGRANGIFQQVPPMHAQMNNCYAQSDWFFLKDFHEKDKSEKAISRTLTVIWFGLFSCELLK